MNRTALCLWILGASSAALGADAAVEGLLGNMRKAYRSVTSASIRVKVSLTTPAGSSTGLLQCDYARPNKVRYFSEIGANSVRRYCDGKQVVTLRGENREADSKVNVDTLGSRVAGNLEWLCFFDWQRQLSTAKGANMSQSALKLAPKEKWNGREWIVLEETAPGQGIFVRYSIDPKTFFIWRCEVFRREDNRRVVLTEVQRLVLGAKFDSSIFVPPPSTGRR